MTDDPDILTRALVHALRFRRTLPDRPPRPEASAAALNAAFGGPTPEAGEDAAAVIDALAAAAEPGLSGPAGARFFGWVIGGSHPVGVAADILTSAWGQNAGLYAAAPAAAVSEAVAGAWLLDILRLPPSASVGFVTGATMASFTCLAAARHRVLAAAGWDVEAHGLGGAPRVRTFVGDAAHPAVESALRYLGLGRPTVVLPTDMEGRIRPADLRQALRAGEGPAIVIAQAGQINTGAFDPVLRLAPICREAGAWLHVDGAFGLWARAVPEFAAHTAGLELADSWAVDGHKWLQLPYDSGFAIVADAEAHHGAMRMVASYLPPAAADEHDPGQLVPELSRRARGFAAWAMLRSLGRRGVAELVRRHCLFARRLATRLAALPGVEVANRVALNQVLLAFGDGEPETRDVLTRAVIARLQAQNLCFAGGARWRGRWVLRISIIAWALEAADIDRLAAVIAEAWCEVEHADARGRCPFATIGEAAPIRPVR